MAYEFEDVDLPGDPFDVGNVNNFLFFEDFDRNLLASSFVNTQFDLAKGSLAEGLFYLYTQIPTRYSPIRLVCTSSALIQI